MEKHHNIRPQHYKGTITGFQVALRYQGVGFTRHVSMKDFDNEDDCLRAAINVRDKLLASLTGDPQANLRTLSKVGNSFVKANSHHDTGLKGITRRGNSFTVSWSENTQPHKKYFSFKAYGSEQLALLAAVKHRKAMVEQHY